MSRSARPSFAFCLVGSLRDLGSSREQHSSPLRRYTHTHTPPPPCTRFHFDDYITSLRLLILYGNAARSKGKPQRRRPPQWPHPPELGPTQNIQVVGHEPRLPNRTTSPHSFKLWVRAHIITTTGNIIPHSLTLLSLHLPNTRPQSPSQAPTSKYRSRQPPGAAPRLLVACAAGRTPPPLRRAARRATHANPTSGHLYPTRTAASDQATFFIR